MPKIYMYITIHINTDGSLTLLHVGLPCFVAIVKEVSLNSDREMTIKE